MVVAGSYWENGCLNTLWMGDDACRLFVFVRDCVRCIWP